MCIWNLPPALYSINTCKCFYYYFKICHWSLASLKQFFSHFFLHFSPFHNFYALCTEPSVQMSCSHKSLNGIILEPGTCSSAMCFPSLKIDWSVFKLNACGTVSIPADQSQGLVSSLLTESTPWQQMLQALQLRQLRQNTDESVWCCFPHETQQEYDLHCNDSV